MREITAESVRYEMQDRTRDLVQSSGLNLKAALHSVAQGLRMTPGRVRQIYYGAARRIDAFEADRVRSLHQQIAALRSRRQAVTVAIRAAIEDEHAQVHQASGDRDGDLPCLAGGCPREGSDALACNPVATGRED